LDERNEVAYGADTFRLGVLDCDAEVVLDIHYKFDSVKSHDSRK